jgi:prophage DNA circulation protein
MNAAFNEAEIIAADQMDEASYMALVKLHAALTFHLIETARPLPRVVAWRFGKPMSTRIVAQRLYYDAARADELRRENKVVHPAFMRNYGRGLSL